MIRYCCLITFYFMFVADSGAKACTEISRDQPFHIIMFQPAPQFSEFWDASFVFANAVARDLDIRLTVVPIKESERNRFAFKQLIVDTLANEQKPDFILSVLYGGGEVAQLTAFNDLKIPFMTFNSSLGYKQLRNTFKPREKFPFWVGHLSPNEFRAGAEMVSLLSQISNGNTLAIISGERSSSVHNHRIEGALEQARQHSITVVSPIYTDWSVESGVHAAKVLLTRAPDIDMIFTAGPDLALGVSVVLSVADKEAAVGSFDWAETNMRLIEVGGLDFSLGGHFMDAGWALILIYDYLQSKDFVDDLGTLIVSELREIDSANIEQYKFVELTEQWDKIDFKHYSKCLNPSRKSYSFELPNIPNLSAMHSN